MALTTEELLLQMQILTEKTDESTNPNMIYKKSKALNKGLNPEYYSGNNTRIVNILNDLFAADSVTTTLTTDLSNKINEILRDTSSEDGQAAWEKLQGAMGQATIIDGLNDLYDGKKAIQVLGVTKADVNKVLSVAQDDNGNLILKAIEQIASEGNPLEIDVNNILYTNENVGSISNVKEALDYAINAIANNEFEGGLGGGSIIGEITWDMIDDRPEFIADNLVIADNQLQLKDGDSIMSTVPITDSNDIDDIVDNL